MHGTATTAEKLTKTARLFGHKVGRHNVHEVTAGVWISQHKSTEGSLEVHP